MPRAHKKPFWPVALSISRASAAIGVPLRIVRDAAYSGAIEAYELPGGRVRIPTESLVAWLRSWPRATLLKHRRKMS